MISETLKALPGFMAVHQAIFSGGFAPNVPVIGRRLKGLNSAAEQAAPGTVMAAVWIPIPAVSAIHGNKR